MNKSKRKPSLLSEQDIFNLEQMDWALNQNEEECVSPACLRYGYGNMPDEDLLNPCQTAIAAFCEDNPQLNADEFANWYQGIIDNEDVFRFDRVMLEAVKEVRGLFDEKTKDWISEGILDSDYDTNYAFWGIIGMAIYTLSYQIRYKYQFLDKDAFFKDSMFGKYKIIALKYADEGSLNDFKNPQSYNRFDIEAILFYIIDRYDAFWEYKEYRDIYDEVKAVVYKDPNQKLSETKAKLEQLAKSSSEKKFQYALLYACAVIEWYLKSNKA